MARKPDLELIKNKTQNNDKKKTKNKNKNKHNSQKHPCDQERLFVTQTPVNSWKLTNNNNNNDDNTIRPDFIIVDFSVPADYRTKLKESEKKDVYLDLAKELKKNDGTWRWQL